jgi:hypothetical protein
MTIPGQRIRLRAFERSDVPTDEFVRDGAQMMTNGQIPR